MNNFYTYAYVRKDGTPYYIGKGKGYRINQKHNVMLPPKERRLLLKTGLTEQDAFKHEVYMISLFGRKDLGTGILHNLTDGGDGTSGYKMSNELRRRCKFDKTGVKTSEETKKKLREASSGRPQSLETRNKRSKTMKGMKFTDEHKKKLSEAAKERYKRCGKINKGKPCKVKGIEFNMIASAAKYFDVSSTTIHNWIRSGK